MSQLLKQLERQGAAARASGKRLQDNPFLNSSNLKARAGEARETWQHLHDAWKRGWIEEDERRG